ncbi:MAG: hypothetical protein ACYS99_04035 [Planctomycetota bacterium]|jgi:hypothetical protein
MRSKSAFRKAFRIGLLFALLEVFVVFVLPGLAGGADPLLTMLVGTGLVVGLLAAFIIWIRPHW